MSKNASGGIRKRLLVARKCPRSRSAAVVSVKANPSSMIDADERGVLAGRDRRLSLARAAAVEVDPAVEGLQQREERLLAPAQRLAAHLEAAQVLGRLEAVGQPEQVQQPLAPVGLTHRLDHPHEGRLVLGEVPRGVAGADGEGADLAELRLQEALLEDAQPRVDVDEVDVLALVALGRGQVGQRGAEQLLRLPEPAREVARRGRVLEEEGGGHPPRPG